MKRTTIAVLILAATCFAVPRERQAVERAKQETFNTIVARQRLVNSVVAHVALGETRFTVEQWKVTVELVTFFRSCDGGPDIEKQASCPQGTASERLQVLYRATLKRGAEVREITGNLHSGNVNLRPHMNADFVFGGNDASDFHEDK